MAGILAMMGTVYAKFRTEYRLSSCKVGEIKYQIINYLNF